MSMNSWRETKGKALNFESEMIRVHIDIDHQGFWSCSVGSSDSSEDAGADSVETAQRQAVKYAIETLDMLQRDLDAARAAVLGGSK